MSIAQVIEYKADTFKSRFVPEIFKLLALRRLSRKNHQEMKKREKDLKKLKQYMKKGNRAQVEKFTTKIIEEDFEAEEMVFKQQDNLFQIIQKKLDHLIDVYKKEKDQNKKARLGHVLEALSEIFTEFFKRVNRAIEEGKIQISADSETLLHEASHIAWHLRRNFRKEEKAIKSVEGKHKPKKEEHNLNDLEKDTRKLQEHLTLFLNDTLAVEYRQREEYTRFEDQIIAELEKEYFPKESMEKIKKKYDEVHKKNLENFKRLQEITNSLSKRYDRKYAQNVREHPQNVQQQKLKQAA